MPCVTSKQESMYCKNNFYRPVKSNFMSKVFRSKFLVLLAFIAWLPSNAQQQGKSIRVFMIGNSFSQNASRYLPNMAREGGYNLELGHAEPGGCSLQRHWDSVAASIADTSRGKLYKGQSLKELLSDGKWNIVTIQQYSLLSADEKTYQPYAKKLYDFIKQLQPDAEVVIHQTWAYRADAKNFGRVDGTKTAKTQQEMWEKSRAAYHALAKELGGLRIIPSGDAFYAVATDTKWAFKKDETFDSANAAAPALPADENSINVGYSRSNDNKLKFDPNHANEAGCYLAGMMWYGTLFGEDPAKLSFKPGTVSDEFAAFLKKTASKTLKAGKK